MEAFPLKPTDADFIFFDDGKGEGPSIRYFNISKNSNKRYGIKMKEFNLRTKTEKTVLDKDRNGIDCVIDSPIPLVTFLFFKAEHMGDSLTDKFVCLVDKDRLRIRKLLVDGTKDQLALGERLHPAEINMPHKKDFQVQAVQMNLSDEKCKRTFTAFLTRPDEPLAETDSDITVLVLGNRNIRVFRLQDKPAPE